MKKLSLILLSIVFLLSTFSFLPVKKAVCNTGDAVMLMAAEPWHWEYHSGKGGSGSSGGDNQRISDPSNRSVAKHSLSSSTRTTGYQRENSMRERLLNWKRKLLFFWQMFFNR